MKSSAFGGEPDRMPSISERNVERHMEKQGVNRRDAERYFEVHGFIVPSDSAWDDPDWPDTGTTVDDVRPRRPITESEATMLKSAGSFGDLVATNTASIVAMEQEVMARAKRMRGWEAAAAMHARVDRHGQTFDGPICKACTDLAELAIGTYDPEWPTVVSWPCDTAKALGIDA